MSVGIESQTYRPRPQGPNTKSQWREAQDIGGYRGRTQRPRTKIDWVGIGPHRAKDPGNQKSEVRVGDPRLETQKGAKGSPLRVRDPPRVRDPRGARPRA